MRNLLASPLALLLTACVFTPKVVSRYDEVCDIEVRHLVLSAEQTGFAFVGQTCNGRDCLVLLAGEVLLVPVSAIVSGSIVLVGNTVFWMQKRGNCQDDDSQPV